MSFFIEKIHGKQYGKQWVYVAKQESLPAPSQDDINSMDLQIDEQKKEILELKEEVIFLFILFFG